MEKWGHYMGFHLTLLLYILLSNGLPSFAHRSGFTKDTSIAMIANQFFLSYLFSSGSYFMFCPRDGKSKIQR